jgi:hypothetical protein
MFPVPSSQPGSQTKAAARPHIRPWEYSSSALRQPDCSVVSRRGETHITFFEALFISLVILTVLVVFVVLVRGRAGLRLGVLFLCGSTRFRVCSLLLLGGHDSN